MVSQLVRSALCPAQVVPPKAQVAHYASQSVASAACRGLQHLDAAGAQDEGSPLSPPGVVEFSSIWLAFADVFHPRQKEYSQWLETAPVTRKLNDAIRALFVLSYMVVRAFYFPYVVWGCYTPDMRALLQLAPAQRQNVSDAELWLPFLGSAFSVLQLYWAQLLVKQLRKMMAAKPDAAKKSA